MIGMRKSRTLRERFEKHVKRTDGCWLWTASRFRTGYVQIAGVPGEGAKSLRAHRVAWELFRGAIPNGLCVLHRCDVRACVNPAHLFLGTVAANNKDMKLKGRNKWPGYRGARNGMAKLTPRRVRAIRRARAEGQSLVVIARRFAVDPSTVSVIALRKVWRHV